MTPPANPLIPFDLEASRIAWDRAADLWHDFVESGKDFYRTEFHGPALLEACGKAEGLDALDLGCGQSYFSRLLTTSGAKVAGVDLSKNLIAHAIRAEEGSRLTIEYHVLGASEVATKWSEWQFDLATSCVAFQDRADMEAVVGAVFRVLKAGGRLVFSIPHPATCTPCREWDRDTSGAKLALKLDRYFESGPRILAWQMARLDRHWETPYWSRTIEEWSEILANAGFLISRLREPRPSAEAVRRAPRLEDGLRLPAFLIFDAIKPG